MGSLTAILALSVLFILIFLGMPVAFAMGLVSLIGLITNIGYTGAMTQMALVPFNSVNQYTMSVIPLFVLMGNLAFTSGLTEDAYKGAYNWMGHLCGGLGIATVAACGAFAACTGSSVASIGTMASTVLPEMRRYNYDNKLSTGVVAAGTTLGILIPPSAPMLIYGLLAGVSIGKLFIGGIVPGLLLMFIFSLIIYLICRFNPMQGPPGPKTPMKEKISSIFSSLPILLLIGVVLGGLWGGIFTAVEAGAVGSFTALLITLFRKRLSINTILNDLKSTIQISTMIFMMLISANLFGYFFAVTGVTQSLAQLVASLHLDPVFIVIAILLIYLIGGCIMDTAGLMMVTLPIFIPIINTIDFNLIIFGILITIMMEMALVTPPIGMNIFILSGLYKEIPISQMFEGVVPFVMAMLFCLVLILIFPGIVMFLPGFMVK